MQRYLRTHYYRTYTFWSRESLGQFYKPYFVAEITGPWRGVFPYSAVSPTLPGSIAKLANVLRRNREGYLDPSGERQDAILGLNRRPSPK